MPRLLSLSRQARKALWPLLIALLCLFAGRQAHAQISCTATATNLNFGVYAPLGGAAATANGSFQYRCTNSNLIYDYNVIACFSIGSGSGSASGFDPHYLLSGSNRVSFSIYQPNSASTLWGSTFSSSVLPYTVSMQVPNASIFGSGQTSGSGTFSATIAGGQTSTVPGSAYASDFSGNHTAIAWAWARAPAMPGGCQSAGSNGGSSSTGANGFPFSVSASVNAYCAITAPVALNFGAVNGLATATTTNQDSFSVQCTNTTPYQIGLLPSNGNTAGTGQMSPTGGIAGNTDKVPYTLYQNAARTAVWGNQTSNGLSGKTGDGAVNKATVYGATPNTNVTPDSYKDTVTVTVTY